MSSRIFASTEEKRKEKNAQHPCPVPHPSPLSSPPRTLASFPFSSKTGCGHPRASISLESPSRPPDTKASSLGKPKAGPLSLTGRWRPGFLLGHWAQDTLLGTPLLWWGVGKQLTPYPGVPSHVCCHCSWPWHLTLLQSKHPSSHMNHRGGLPAGNLCVIFTALAVYTRCSDGIQKDGLTLCITSC